MSNTHSRRWIETDKHIRQTALELLNRPEAHNLSVRLICEEAGINRTTFYEHYLDIYDLLDKLELDVMAELWDYYVQMIDRSNHLPPQPFLPLLAHIRANQDFYKNVLKTRETCRLKPVFERFLTEAVCAACRKAGVKVYEYTPLQVKQAVVGYGRAEKRQVMDMVKRLCELPAPPKPDDAADAVALALCHARSATSLLYRGDQEECSTI